MECRHVRFSRHAIQRMFERSIPQAHVLETLRYGAMVEDYPTDRPYRSRLLLGASGERPLHVVMAHDSESGLCIVVTVYIPDASQWSDDFKTRKAT